MVDGQQRIETIRLFFLDKFILGEDSSDIDGNNLSEQCYSQLDKIIKRRLENAPITLAIIKKASQDELRLLFARLQLGVPLNAAELRNSIASAIGSAIDSMAKTHPFFVHSNIPNTRYKRQDYLAHCVALAHYGSDEEVKAPLIKKLYESQRTKYDHRLMSACNRALDVLAETNAYLSRYIKNKWSVIDLFWFVYNGQQTGTIDTQKLADLFKTFEAERLEHNQDPKALLNIRGGEHLYNYILNFNSSQSNKTHLKDRAIALRKKMANSIV